MRQHNKPKVKKMTIHNIKLIFSIFILTVSINTARAMILSNNGSESGLNNINEADIKNVRTINNEFVELYWATLPDGKDLICEYSRKPSEIKCFKRAFISGSCGRSLAIDYYDDIPVHLRYFDVLKKIAEQEKKLPS
jgi:hypothetical protein